MIEDFCFLAFDGSASGPQHTGDLSFTPQIGTTLSKTTSIITIP